MSIPLSPPLIQISRCCLRASHTPSTTWAAPRTLIRSGSSTNHIPILRVLLGPTTHSRECSSGARNSISPSPTVIIAKTSMSLLFHTGLFSSLYLGFGRSQCGQYGRDRPIPPWSHGFAKTAEKHPSSRPNFGGARTVAGAAAPAVLSKPVSARPGPCQRKGETA
jgi:hypothetical protein